MSISTIRSTTLRLALTLAVAAGSLFGLAGVSEAGTLVLNYEPNAYSDGTDGGGEFKVTNLTGFPTPIPTMGAGVQVTTGGVTGAFQTFCLEYYEHFTPGSVTYNYSIDTAAIGGGNRWSGALGSSALVSAGGSDSLDPMTAYLYTQFWNGTLSWVDGVSLATESYKYGTFGNVASGNRAASALALQRAIWFIEGERSLLQIGNSTSDAAALVRQAQLAVAVGGSWWLANHDASGKATIGNVRVMNLTTASGALAQSQLAMINVDVVPLPPAAWTGLAMMSAMGALTWVRRRRMAL